MGVTILTFVLTHIIPGDPVHAALGFNVRQEQIESLREKMGLDKPLHEQYLRYMWRLLHGDLGISLTSYAPVTRDLSIRFTATFELISVSMIIIAFIGIVLGVISATNHNKAADKVISVVSLMGISTPQFWLCLLFQFFLYRILGWLPYGGRIDQGLEPSHITGLYLFDSIITGNLASFTNAFTHIIMPLSVLVWVCLPMVVRITRATMIDVISQDYIKAAKAQGFPRKTILYGRALKNTLIPTITILAIIYAFNLGNMVVVETVFEWPGVAQYAVNAVLNNDFNPVMGFGILMAVIVVVINYAVDLIYGIVDPRIRYG